MNRVEPNRNVYIGHRYVPLLVGEWDKSIQYEGLSIVTHKGASYTSKKRVPVGIEIENEEFWVVTGNYNAQIEYYRDETERVSDDLAQSKIDLNKRIDDTVQYVDTNVEDLTIYVNDEVRKNKDYVDGEVEELQTDLNKTNEAINEIESYNKRKEVNIWDFEYLVTNKPDPLDSNTWDWTQAVQAAFKKVSESFEFNKLRFTPGIFKINDSIVVYSEIDSDQGIHVVGSGRSTTTGNSTTIEMTNPEKSVIRYWSTTGNMRGILMDDITIYGGSYGLDMRFNAYNLFRNVVFSRQNIDCIRDVAGDMNVFDNCWFVHSFSNILYKENAGRIFFNNCVFGEDVGGFELRDGEMHINNCHFFLVSHKKNALGDFDFGLNMFLITDGGRLHMNGCFVAGAEDLKIFFTLNNIRPSTISNCRFVMRDKTFMKSRYMSISYAGSPLKMTNNTLEYDGSGVLFSDGVGVASSPLRNSIFSNNVITKKKDSVITTSDWFLNPEFNNQASENTIVESDDNV